MLLVATLWFTAHADFGSDQYRHALIGLFTLAVLAAFEILMPLGAAFLHIGQIIASAERITEITEQEPLVHFDGNATIGQLNLAPNMPLIEAKICIFIIQPSTSGVKRSQFLVCIRGQK